MLKFLLPFLLSLLLSFSLTPIIIRISNKYGFIVEPREDRWHKKPTALLGGIGIFLAFVVPYLIFIPMKKLTIGILLCTLIIFTLGLLDDIFSVTPQVKLVIQLAVAIIAIFFGITAKIIPYPLISIPLTILWIVGITNALNILDNMDGLAAGISFIAASSIFIYSLFYNLTLPAILSIILAGSTLGFLKYNFNPAKIFMGDCGSLFLGFTLSLITIIGTWRTAVTNLLLALMVPLAVMIIPIFNMTLVTFTRRDHGRAMLQGGKDHSSHRLVFLGFPERKAVLILMAISALFGLNTIMFSKLNFFIALLILVLMAICLTFFGVFLGELKVHEKKISAIYKRSLLISRILLHKKQILQIIVDMALICTAYFSSYLLRYERVISSDNLSLIEKSLPLIIVIKILIFLIFGLYKGEWRYIGISNFIKTFKATLLGSLFSVIALVSLFRFEGYSIFVFVIDYLITFLLIGGVRILIRTPKGYFSSVVMPSLLSINKLLILKTNILIKKIINIIKNSGLNWIQLFLIGLTAPIFLFPSMMYVWILFVIPGIWFFRWIVKKHFFERTVLDWAFVVLLIQVFASCIIVPDLNFSLPKITGVLFGLFVFYSIGALLISEKLIKCGIIGFLGGGLMLSVIGLLDMQWTSVLFFKKIIPKVAENIPKIRWSLPGAELGFNANAIGGILILIIPLSLLLLLSYLKEKKKNYLIGYKLFTLLFFFVILFVICIVLFLTQSIGSWLGLLISIWILLFPWKWKKWSMMLILVSVLCLVLLNTNITKLIINEVKIDITLREPWWVTGINTISQSPFFGIGMNQFRKTPTVYYEIAHVHNHLLHTAAELGIPGLIAYLAILIGAGFMCFEIWRKSNIGWMRISVLGLGCGQLAHFFFGIADSIPLGAKVGIFFWISLGLIAAIYNYIIINSS